MSVSFLKLSDLIINFFGLLLGNVLGTEGTMREKAQPCSEYKFSVHF